MAERSNGQIVAAIVIAIVVGALVSWAGSDGGDRVGAITGIRAVRRTRVRRQLAGFHPRGAETDGAILRSGRWHHLHLRHACSPCCVIRRTRSARDAGGRHGHVLVAAAGDVPVPTHLARRQGQSLRQYQEPATALLHGVDHPGPVGAADRCGCAGSYHRRGARAAGRHRHRWHSDMVDRHTHRDRRGPAEIKTSEAIPTTRAGSSTSVYGPGRAIRITSARSCCGRAWRSWRCRCCRAGSGPR